MDDIKLWEKRNYLVVKSNDLVQKSRYELSLLEQKVVACICSLIKPEHAKEAMENGHTLEYQFNIRDFCRICGIDCNNGKNYINVRAVLKKRPMSFPKNIPTNRQIVETTNENKKNRPFISLSSLFSALNLELYRINASPKPRSNIAKYEITLLAIV